MKGREKILNKNAKIRHPSFKLGDEVYVRNLNAGKLEELFEGPSIITKANSTGTFELKDNTEWPYCRILNVPQLKGPAPLASVKEQRDNVTKVPTRLNNKLHNLDFGHS
jgi:hypothetical protein